MMDDFILPIAFDIIQIQSFAVAYILAKGWGIFKPPIVTITDIVKGANI